jgi:hypothetical protein
MYGIMGLKKGGKGPPGSGSAKHAGFKGYKTGSRKGTAAGDKGDKKSQARTARELDQMIKGGDLDRIVTRGRQDQGYRSGFSSPSTVIGGMTQKQQDFINRNRRKDGSLNSAAQSVLDFYSDDRSDYQRDLNKFIKSSPGARKAYLDRFPIGGALNLGIPAAFNALAPAPIKMLGSMAGDIGTGAYTAAKKFIPEQIRKDVGPGLQKLWGDVKAVPSGLARHGKALLTGKLDQNLDQTQKANLGIIKDEETTAKADLIEGEKTLEDTQLELLEDLLGTDEGAATETVDATQDIAYDPAQDLADDIRNSLAAHRDWSLSGYYPTNKASASSPYETGAPNPLEDIFDPSQDVMPNVPVTMDEKRDAISKAYGWSSAAVADNPDWLNNEYYQDLRKKQDQGMTYGTRGTGPGEGFQGVINRSYWPEWQHPDTAKLVDQINWNTANRPLDWSGGETPELTDELIRENLKTGSDLYPEVFTNQTRSNIPSGEDQVSELGLPMDMEWQTDPYEKLSLDELINLGASEDQIADYLNISQVAEGGYLKKYDDGGYANMSTYEKLKAINDSIAEG